MKRVDEMMRFLRASNELKSKSRKKNFIPRRFKYGMIIAMNFLVSNKFDFVSSVHPVL